MREGLKIAEITTILFKGKQNIQWNDVEHYLKKYIGIAYKNMKYGDIISIPGDFPDEYCESRYTKSLRGALAKAKANAAQVIDSMIVYADNRRWIENKNAKHENHAPSGWYRYDAKFSIPVSGSNEKEMRQNVYRATLVVRIQYSKLFLYDIINIKKEASTPLES